MKKQLVERYGEPFIHCSGMASLNYGAFADGIGSIAISNEDKIDCDSLLSEAELTAEELTSKTFEHSLIYINENGLHYELPTEPEKTYGIIERNHEKLLVCLEDNSFNRIPKDYKIALEQCSKMSFSNRELVIQNRHYSEGLSIVLCDLEAEEVQIGTTRDINQLHVNKTKIKAERCMIMIPNMLSIASLLLLPCKNPRIMQIVNMENEPIVTALIAMDEPALISAGIYKLDTAERYGFFKIYSNHADLWRE